MGGGGGGLFDGDGLAERRGLAGGCGGNRAAAGLEQVALVGAAVAARFELHEMG